MSRRCISSCRDCKSLLHATQDVDFGPIYARLSGLPDFSLPTGAG